MAVNSDKIVLNQQLNQSRKKQILLLLCLFNVAVLRNAL